MKFRYLIIIIVTLGIVFRFVNLDKKVYWYDESYTSVRIAGYPKNEMTEQLFNGEIITIHEVQRYQRPTAEKNLLDTIKELAKEEPQLPPLYFAIARLWEQVLGHSVASIRALSALISLLIFPAMYWLCQELFASQVVSAIALALVAIAPFHLLYAQEARPYSLWIVTILLSSAALLRARRLNTKMSWFTYALLLVTAFYTFLFSGFVAIAHGIYVFCQEKFKFSRTFINYLVATVVAFLLFLPWILVVIIKSDMLYLSVKWTEDELSLGQLFYRWGLNLSRIFVDFNADSNTISALGLIFTLLSLALSGYGIYFIIRHARQETWLFPILLMSATTLPLMLPDLILGGRRSAIPRYLIPAYLGIELVVAYLLSAKINSVNQWTAKILRSLMAVVITAGVLSGILITQADCWWTKAASCDNLQIAQIINQSPRPLLISHNSVLNPGNLFSLSYELDPKVQLQLVLPSNLPQIDFKDYSDVYLYNTFEDFESKLTHYSNAKLELIYDRNNLKLKQLKPQQLIGRFNQ